MIGTRIGQFVLNEKLGEGSMGEVYRAHDTLVNRDVALKILRRELATMSNVVERFHVEAQSLARLNHPNVAGLYTFFQHEGGHVMAIEYVPGRTLERILRDHGPLDEATATGVAFQVLAALAHAHSIGVIHRDIKPANIIVTETGSVKVTDFSIAKIVGGAKLTKQGSIVGTMEYMAPERLQGHPSDHRSDLYSAGAVLYEMLTGHVPFEHAREIDLIQAHIRDQPPPMSSHGRWVCAPVEAVVLRALAKNPGARFNHAVEFQQALSLAMSGAGIATPPAAPVPVAAKSAPSPIEEMWRKFSAYTIPLPGVPVRYSTAPWIAAATLAAILLVSLVVAALIPPAPEEAPNRLSAPPPTYEAPRREMQRTPEPEPAPFIPPPAPPVATEPPPPKQEAESAEEAAERERRRKSLEALGIEPDKPEETKKP
jgi:serine/threonine-protein kinase